MIAKVRGANARLEFGSSAIPPPGTGTGLVSYTGRYVNTDQMFGLPAVMAAIRLVSETVASFELKVYRGKHAAKTEATGTWQWKLFQQPNSEQSVFDWLVDVSAGPEGFGNSFVRKIKAKGRVTELVPIDPDYVRVRRDKSTGEKVFDVRMGSSDTSTRTLTAQDILHIRGYTPRAGSVSGLSPIQVFRNPLGMASSLEEYAGRFFRNDATPNGAIQVPGPLTKTQAVEMLDHWADRHGGLQNKHKPALLYNNATWQPIGVNMADAQWVLASQHSVEDVARMFRIPAIFLEGGMRQAGKGATSEDEAIKLLVFSILPRVRRIEQAFRADPDLFGQTDLYPEFNTDPMLRADAVSQATVDKEAIQSGWKVPDEVRADHGLPPLPDGLGQIPQLTPVGGAVNPQLAPVTQYAEIEAQQVAQLDRGRYIGADPAVPVGILAELREVFRPEFRMPQPVVNLEPTVTVDMAPVAAAIDRLTQAIADRPEPLPPQVTNEIIVQPTDVTPDFPPTVVKPKTIVLERDNRTGLVKSMTVEEN